ncbi:MAG TPA: ferredoxin [Ignavibacteriaceae bacterium]|jgi:ferredoxin|nr:ferredoxin [Ignavibacteriaceae bacterium]
MEKTISGLKIIIDEDMCIGTSNCIRVAGEVFVLDNQKIVTFRPDISEIEQKMLIEACSVCPVNALTAIDENGNQVVP